MKVLMLGWELPPLQVGGLGMICYEIVKELSLRKIPVTYIMPMGPKDARSEFANLIVAENHILSRRIKFVDLIRVPGFFGCYQSPEQYEKEYEKFLLNKNKKGFRKITKKDLYGPNLPTEVDLYAKRVYHIVDDLDFDIIHAHDWLTYPAAIGIAEKTGKPLVVHIHNTVFDRYLGNASKWEKDIEFNGLQKADLVIALSEYVKNMVSRYGINLNKVRIIHNAKNTLISDIADLPPPFIKDKKIVLFSGRVTIQKGVEYLVMAAKKVLEKRKDVLFIIMGTGDEAYFSRVLKLAAEFGISKNVIFTGKAYNMQEVKTMYKLADCYIMPSVSEPFGIVPMEAMKYDTPTIISKQSGCSEVLNHALKVDFWDTDEMANQILSILSYKSMQNQMKDYGKKEVEAMTWDKYVDKLMRVYFEAIDMKKN